MSSNEFRSKMNPLELEVYDSSVLIIEIFLGSHKTENGTDLINNGIILHSHLDCFFHIIYIRKVISMVKYPLSYLEDGYQGDFNPNIMNHYCWFLY